MPVLKESATAVLLRGDRVTDGFATEPYETGWASEAVVFVLGLDDGAGGNLSAQLSPDGMNWVDEGAEMVLPAKGQTAFLRLGHFGNWLRFEARLPEGGERRLTLTLQLKG
jgi:hypothetical protein